MNPERPFVLSTLSSLDPSTIQATISAVNNGTSSSFALSNINLATLAPDPYQSVRSTLFSSLLVALASEHAYILARMAIRHLIDRTVWRASPEEAAMRRGIWRLRHVYLANAEAKSQQPMHSSQVKAATGPARPSEADTFCGRPDQGLAEIQREGKTE
jgi:anoctamin-10